MAKSFLTNLDLKGNQLLNSLIQPATSAPTAKGAGHMYYNTSSKLLYVYDGTAFTPINGGVVVGASTLYGTTTFAGTAGQITLTASGSTPNGTVTISLPTAITLSTGGSVAFPGATSGTVTLQAQSTTASSTISLPSTASNDTLVARNTTDTLTNKTLTSPTINGGSATALTGLAIRSTGTGAFDLTFANTENLTAGRTLTLTTNDANRTINLGGNITTGGAFTTASSFATSGNFALTLTATGITNATIPVGTVTLVDLSSTQSLTNKTISGLTVSTTTGTLTIPAATIAFSGANNVTFTSSGTTSLTLPTTGTLATLAGTEALTNKTVNKVTITAPTTSATLTLADGSSLVTSGANSITLTSTGATNVTLPTSGTLVNTSVTTLSSLSSIGTITSGVWNGTNIALANGGTNASLTATAGGIVYSTASAMAISAAGTSGYLLTSGGTGAPTWTQASSTNVNSAVVQRDSSGNIAVSQVTVSTDPSQALQVATKQYVDNIATGVNAHQSVVTATTANLTATYNNGTSGVGATLTNSGTQAVLVIDGVTPIVGDRILVKNQSTNTQNGIYTVTSVGSGSTNWVLTRANDYDQSTPGEVDAGDMVYVISPAAEITGTPTNQGTGWIMNSPGTIVIGTSAITFVQTSGTGTVTAGNGIVVTGNSVAVSLGSAFDNTTGTGTSGLSLSGGTLQVRLSSTGGLTSSTAGIAINTPGTGLTLSGNAISYATGTTTQSGTGVSGGAYTYATQKQVATITGDSTTSSFTINHNLATRDVQVQVYQTSATPDTQYAEVEVDITRATTGTITVAFATAPATGITYNVVMVG
jgi:hypothetical protein